MSAAIIADNTTIRVNNQIGSSRLTTGVLYTAPSTGYAEVQISAQFITGAGTTIVFDINGYPIAFASATGSGVQFNGQYIAIGNGAGIATIPSIRIGNGQVLSATFGAANLAKAIVTGIELINSP